MNVIRKALQKEYARNDYMRSHYLHSIDALPKGSLVLKVVGKHEYHYLKYRAGKRTITKYIGNDCEILDATRGLIEKRKHEEALLKELNKEHDVIVRLLRVVR